MPALVAGIHAFLVAKTWMARNSGLPELRMKSSGPSRINPTWADKPGHDAFVLSASGYCGDPRKTPSLKNTRKGVVPVAPPSKARHLPFRHSVPPAAGTASNSTKFG
jgi:hypothetical protein